MRTSSCTSHFSQKWRVHFRQEVDARPNESEKVGFKKLRMFSGRIESLAFKHGATRISLVGVGKTLSVCRIPQGERCLPRDTLAPFLRRSTVTSISYMNRSKVLFIHAHIFRTIRLDSLPNLNLFRSRHGAEVCYGLPP